MTSQCQQQKPPINLELNEHVRSGRGKESPSAKFRLQHHHIALPKKATKPTISVIRRRHNWKCAFVAKNDMATFQKQLDLTLKAIALIMPHQVIDIGRVIWITILENNDQFCIPGYPSSKCISSWKLREMWLPFDAAKEAAQAEEMAEKVLCLDARSSLHLREWSKAWHYLFWHLMPIYFLTDVEWMREMHR